MTSQAMTVKLTRGDNTSWGFRLQGGKDFSTPLSIQRVNPGSLADGVGLTSGDVILKIGGKSTESMKHKEAQDAIIRAGNNLEMVLQRGGIRVWKPTVTPVGNLPAVSPSPSEIYTKTSLAAKKQEVNPIGSKHNVSAKPFANVGEGKLLVSNQYNSPAPIYSLNNIAETLSAHTEVLASGAKGINFMKEPQPVNKESAVYRMIQEEEKFGGETTKSETCNHMGEQSCAQRKDSPVQQPKMTQHVSAPITKPVSNLPQRTVDPNACADCGKMIIGVFVRIKDKSLHPECFKCSTCGSSLKNVGYFNVNDKLYCDIHAKQAAKVMSSSPPSYEPVQLSQTQDQPTYTSSAPPSAAPTSPACQSMSPVSFQKPGNVQHTEAMISQQTIMSPPIFKTSAVPFLPPPASSTFKCTSVSQQFVTTSPTPPSVANVTSPVHTGPAGSSKFVWPPPKNIQPNNVLPSNATPTLPSYRPPPGTQHAPSKFSSQTSVMPEITRSLPSQSQKISPTVSPKPYIPVQSSMIANPGNPSRSSTHITSTASSLSTGAMTAGTGSCPAPMRGRGQLKSPVGVGARIPICSVCGTPIRGPFVTASGKTWCPEHFICCNNRCQTSLADIGFIEIQGQLYCEHCYEAYLAPQCSKCGSRIKGDCLNALDKQWHPECFLCAYCHKPFGNSPFYMEDGLPYCQKDYNELFTTKCVGCGFPIEAGDRWVEALCNNYHSQCFKCLTCHKSLEGQSFYAKSGRPYCKVHAR